MNRMLVYEVLMAQAIERLGSLTATQVGLMQIETGAARRGYDANEVRMKIGVAEPGSVFDGTKKTGWSEVKAIAAKKSADQRLLLVTVDDGFPLGNPGANHALLDGISAIDQVCFENKKGGQTLLAGAENDRGTVLLVDLSNQRVTTFPSRSGKQIRVAFYDPNGSICYFDGSNLREFGEEKIESLSQGDPTSGRKTGFKLDHDQTAISVTRYTRNDDRSAFVIGLTVESKDGSKKTVFLRGQMFDGRYEYTALSSIEQPVNICLAGLSGETLNSKPWTGTGQISAFVRDPSGITVLHGKSNEITSEDAGISAYTEQVTKAFQTGLAAAA